MTSFFIFSSLFVQTVRICEILTAPENGEILGNCYNTYGSSCEFGCSEGYELTGSATRTCTIDDSDIMVWNGTVVTCQGMRTNITYTKEISTKESNRRYFESFCPQKNTFKLK